MADVYHHYVGKGQKPPPRNNLEASEREKWDLKFREERAEHERIRREEREIKLAERKGELCPNPRSADEIDVAGQSGASRSGENILLERWSDPDDFSWWKEAFTHLSPDA